MKFTQGKPHKTLRRGDSDFTFSPDGLTIVPRASFEISEKCPVEYQRILYECWGNGWINPIAHMRDTEYIVELLRK
jgi:hypothetical protein